MLYVLSDSLSPWHSFWIRIGQYLDQLPTEVGISSSPEVIHRVSNKDILLFYRYAHDWGPFSEALSKLKTINVPIISDVDDYLWEAPSWDNQRVAEYTQSLKMCDIITCSTEALLRQVSVMFNKVCVKLMPNTMPASIKLYQPNTHGTVRIGWTGAAWTRPNDLKELSCIAEYINCQPGLEIVHIGHNDRMPSLADFTGIKDDKIRKHSLCGHKDYLGLFNFDIGLAPLSRTIFNYHKSAIKLIEYSSAGIPWIASDSPGYREICRKWSWSGRLCRSDSDWIFHLKTLVNDTSRSHEGLKLASLCRRHCGYISGVEAWKDLILSL